jgi:hypothetical protein
MNANGSNRIILIAVLGLSAVIATTRLQPVQAQRDAAPAGHRYSVVETEGHNLIVTDNQTETLYFYTIDKDKEIGTELKLRGSVDLKQVGKPIIKPTKPKETKE